MAKYMEATSPKLAGDWRVAPLPQWSAGQQVSGNWGGANLFVFKGSKHPAEAAKFALWLTSDPEAQKLNVTNGGILPATVDATQTVPALQEGTKYLGGQKQWDLFGDLSAKIPTSWVWGPTQVQLEQAIQDGVAAALGNKKKLPDVFAGAQAKTIATMKDQAISVGE
jgi:multiple sugar transport system substrate-binding protein